MIYGAGVAIGGAVARAFAREGAKVFLAAQKDAVRRSESFDEVAELYAAARPAYPEALVGDLILLTDLNKTHRVLEIGAGTGQLTMALAERGISLVAVERGPNLAHLLMQNVTRFAHVKTVVADFDAWNPQLGQFDVVAAASAFHWLNPSMRVRKCVGLLRPGGTLAIVNTHWGAGARDDRFALESQTCYARWDPCHDPSFRPMGPEDLPAHNEELEASDLFAEVIHRRYFCEREYSSRAYCDLLGTFSNVRAFEERSRNDFLACVCGLIEDRFEGSVARTDVYDLWLARTGPEPKSVVPAA